MSRSRASTELLNRARILAVLALGIDAVALAVANPQADFWHDQNWSLNAYDKGLIADRVGVLVTAVFALATIAFALRGKRLPYNAIDAARLLTAAVVVLGIVAVVRGTNTTGCTRAFCDALVGSGTGNWVLEYVLLVVACGACWASFTQVQAANGG